ncbi:class I SAM-dependent DNA methyltransferase [Xanthobacter agilis]|uniref:site-specific DNA-methyltransferase (adenine-specific) n=1 Tax=Xanthobacter agilis TaxID=47492 RepID=A0ABU0LC23_XANAG|nr:DNA methyltransferase [Xanthobacter agilis]MDQ0504680.1 hypothetical protein [Xanthobacter agilis]
MLSTAERQKTDGRGAEAAKTVQAFHDKLCDIQVLDPACGTGNFLYVALELMKRLEGEVLEAVADLGGQEALTGLESHTVDPHQFLGLELNPRAAAIAELVLWIGHLQWYVRTRGGLPSDPILRAFRNIEARDAVLTWDGYPRRQWQEGEAAYPNPRAPDWPKADFIVGNPPFIGGSLLRARLGDAYARALWAAHPHMNESADFVMYWWDQAAQILLRRGTALKRFGFVTTNSISQVFQRRVMERYLSAKKPLSLVMAIPDHPWTKATRDSAAVRIAMTVAEAGKSDGLLREVVSEADIDTDAPVILFADKAGRINPDLSCGTNTLEAQPLLSNTGVGGRGVQPIGMGFLLEPDAYAKIPIQERRHFLKKYLNGRDLSQKSRNLYIIDAYKAPEYELLSKASTLYQHILLYVRPERIKNHRASYREKWWQFGENMESMRKSILGIDRYIVSTRTAKHKIFIFVDGKTLCDSKINTFGFDDAWILGVLSSSFHRSWAIARGGWLGIGNDHTYNHTECFDPFPFPDATEPQKAAIRAIAEELDAHRKRVLERHEHLTLTGLYNVLEQLKAGVAPAGLEPRDRRIFDDGLVLILKELHDRLDAAVADAYGWPADLPDDAVLARLVALNKARAKEEKRGLVRWLRPDYQIPRFGSEQEKARQIEADLGEADEAKAAGPRPTFPKGEMEQTAVVMDALATSPAPMDAPSIAAGFRPGPKVKAAVADILSALFRLGVIATTDGGKTFSLRKAA